MHVNSDFHGLALVNMKPVVFCHINCMHVICVCVVCECVWVRVQNCCRACLVKEKGCKIVSFSFSLLKTSCMFKAVTEKLLANRRSIQQQLKYQQYETSVMFSVYRYGCSWEYTVKKSYKIVQNKSCESKAIPGLVTTQARFHIQITVNVIFCNQ